MNEAKELLANLIKDSVETIKEGAVWVSGEIPLLIQEILIFNGVKAAFSALFGLTLIVVPLIVAIKIMKAIRKKESSHREAKNMYHKMRSGDKTITIDSIRGVYPDLWSDGEPYRLSVDEPIAFTCIITVILGLTGSFIFVTNTIVLLKITLAPRLYLIEYAASIIK